MIKKLLQILVISTVFVSYSMAQVNRKYFPVDVIKNNNISAFTIFEKTQNDSTPIVRVDFDSAFREIVYSDFESCFELSEYDNNGLLISQRFFPFGSTIPFTEYIYIYDNQNKLIDTKIKKLYGGNSSDYKTYQDNLLIKSQESKNSWTEFKYDSLGYKSVETQFYNGEKRRTYLTTYDKYDNLLARYHCSGKGDTLNYTLYEYNDKQLRVNYTCYDKNKEISQLYKLFYNTDNTIQYEEEYTDIINNDLANSTFKKLNYTYERSIKFEDTTSVPESHLSISILQNEKEFIVKSKGAKIKLHKSPFSISFTNKEYDSRNMKFYSAQLFATLDKNLYDKISIDKNISDVPCLSPGNGMSGGKGPFKSLYIKCANHNLIYENKFSSKLNVLEKGNGFYTLEFPVNQISLNRKDFNLENFNQNNLFLVLFIDRNLNHIIDENELYKMQVTFK